MAVLPAVTAGVSVISSVASLSAKNKQAKAEKAALAEQQTQAMAQANATREQLAAAQQLAQQQYGLTTLARVASLQQQQFGAQAQQQLVDLKAQQEQYAIDAGALQQEIGGVVQNDQLKRQRFAIQADAGTKMQVADARQAAADEAIAGQAQQVQQALTAEERRQLAMQTSSRLRSSSSDTAQSQSLMQRTAAALSAGLDLDRQAVLAELQNMGETNVAKIGEQLGLHDNATNVENVAANLRMMRLSAQNAKQAATANQENDSAALDCAQRQYALNNQLDQEGAQRAYDAALKGYQTQGQLNSVTAQSVNRNFYYARSQVKGASLFDYLNAGVSAYGAVSPLIGGAASAATAKPTLYSGFPNVNSNVG